MMCLDHKIFFNKNTFFKWFVIIWGNEHFILNGKYVNGPFRIKKFDFFPIDIKKTFANYLFPLYFQEICIEIKALRKLHTSTKNNLKRIHSFVFLFKTMHSLRFCKHHTYMPYFSLQVIFENVTYILYQLNSSIKMLTTIKLLTSSEKF